MSYEDAAAILKIPVGTIRSRLSRGRDALRQLMGMEIKSTSAAAVRNMAAKQFGDAPLAQAA
jgi:RNA polymerase sigma-70 factor (ECF subfamily)